MYQPKHKWLGEGGRIRRRGIYWLPNLFTTIALFAGFFSIVQAMNGRFEQSALAIFVALVFDGLDGRVARFTHTQSAFGAEYDSLADMVSFGVAPALVIYVWALKDFSAAQNIPLLGSWLTTKLGWVAAFIYCACAALRLARFNTNIEVVDKRFFQGLPSPAAACVVAGMVWAMNEYQIRGVDVKWLAWALTVFAGLTMVSNLKYYSGKDINPRKSVSFPVVVAIALAVVVMVAASRALPEMLFILFLGYALSGYAIAAWDMIRRKGGGGQPPAAPAP
ncbi:MAG: CDP-diacylglycerol--serine O-phosphatidyltransferase [Betaproteobacteria bacterium]|nr:CDP-diacylglycerol--serine O-phosphatidyltransferase [Betaproteobacteria bacterium]